MGSKHGGQTVETQIVGAGGIFTVGQTDSAWHQKIVDAQLAQRVARD